MRKEKILHVRIEPRIYKRLQAVAERLDLPLVDIVRRSAEESLPKFESAELPRSRSAGQAKGCK